MATYTYTTTATEDALIAFALANINASRAAVGDKPLTAQDLIVIGCQRLLGQFAIDQGEADKAAVSQRFAVASPATQATIKTALGL